MKPSETRQTPDGPAAHLSTELIGGDSVVLGAVSANEVLVAARYEQYEFAAAGTAESYAAVGELTADGVWTVRPERAADYRTRIVVRRPSHPADASGVVIVEWLNVSGGLDADPDWVTVREDITRNGDIWVGVSAQMIGIEGGVIVATTPEAEAVGAGRGIRNVDPERYGDLRHPGDDFAYDIYTQVARALSVGGEALGGVAPELMLAMGDSQSAFALVTYINAVHPIARVFDGFLLHSRGGPGLPLTSAAGAADVMGAIAASSPAILRGDGAEPVLVLQSETDVTGFLRSVTVRQDDSDTYRLWEVAGTAHADTRLLGPGTVVGGTAINDGPMHLVAKAAYRSLVTWAGGGEPPARAPRLELVRDTDQPTIARDGDGIALGGIRTPLVDAPVDVLSGEPAGDGSEILSLLAGSTTPLPRESLLARYADVSDYRARYQASADAAIEAGFVLADDRDVLLNAAQPDRIG